MKVNAWTGISTIARLAFRECARSRVLHALVASMALALGVAYIFGWVAGGDSAAHRSSKVVLDLSLSAISVLGSMAAIFLGTGLVYQEVERRTVYGLLARPVSRSGFLIGKYLGLIAVLGIAMIFMSLILLGGFLLIGGEVTGALLAALALTYVELCVITAVALLFAVLAHPIEGAVFTFVITVAGHATASLKELSKTLVGGPEASGWQGALDSVLFVVYVVFPNLENFNLRTHAAHHLQVDPFWVIGSLGYAGVYVTITLALACLVFRGRSL